MITNSGNLNLNLDTDTDAFKSAPAEELATMLRHIADQIEDGMTSGYHLTDSNDEGSTAWEVELPEAMEEDDNSDDLDELDEKYVDFIVKMYQSVDDDKDKLVDTYRLNYDRDLGYHESVDYIADLAREDTTMGPSHYLFLMEFRNQLIKTDELPDNADSIFGFSR